jgi:exonuclease III
VSFKDNSKREILLVDQPLSDQQTAATPHIIVDHHKEMSSSEKSLLIAGVVVLAVVVGVGGSAIYRNTQLDAASCVSSTYKSGTQDKCVGYFQKMVNGIETHFAGIEHNNLTMQPTTLTVNSKADGATMAQLSTVRRYAGASTTGQVITSDDWRTVCTWARKAYRAYTSDLRPSNVQTAREAYKSAGCSGLTVTTVSSDDPTVPAPDSGTSASDSTAIDTPTADDTDTTAQSATSRSSSTQAVSNSASALKITTWNVEGGGSENTKNSAAKKSFATARSTGLAALAKTSDIISLQESHITTLRSTIASNFTCVQSTCPLAGIDLTHTYSKEDASKEDGSLPASIPILWNKTRFTLKDYGTYTALKSGYKDASGDWVSLKWINWVKLQDKTTAKPFFVVNTHTVAGIEALGQPKSTDKKKAAGQRLNTYINHMDLLVNLIGYLKEENIPIFVTGDFNVNYRYDSLQSNQYKDFPYARFGAIALKSNYQLTNMTSIASSAGTQGSGTRLIDYIFSWDKGNIGYLTNTIGTERYGSDHSPVTMTVDLD